MHMYKGPVGSYSVDAPSEPTLLLDCWVPVGFLSGEETAESPSEPGDCGRHVAVTLLGRGREGEKGEEG